MTSWDYEVRVFRIDRRDLDDGGISLMENELCRVGSEGWELVSVMPTVTHVEYKALPGGYHTVSSGGERGAETPAKVMAFLKRPTPGQP